LKDYKEAFEFDELGTPQGCCLSPLLGNILLHQFDLEMTRGDITCLRYLDDFLILGPSERAVSAAFRRAQKLLRTYGLEAYDPQKEQPKAKIGSLNEPFVYLGAKIHGKRICPSDDSRRKLIRQLSQMIQESLNFFQAEVFPKNHSFVQTLYDLSNKIKGWGDQYSFCNDDSLWGSLDQQISTLVNGYLKSFAQCRSRLLTSAHKAWQRDRRLLGVPLLVDCKREPVIFS
jgi:RNA-directed DNA polymerase